MQALAGVISPSKRQRTKKLQTKVLALGPADPTLDNPTVVAKFAFPHVQKQIEQVGTAYEALKAKYALLTARIENGASATFDSSESEEEVLEI
jgi:DnaJ family protein C protein 2